jgi:hypothetical protein
MHNRYAVFDRPGDGDRLCIVTGTVIKRTAATVGTTAALVVGSLLLAGPASAEVPVGWGTQEPVDKVHVLAFLVGIPVLLFLLIAACVYLPSLARGERVAPGATGPEDQWLGGRRSAGEITSGDRASASEDGGASARW